MLEIFKYNNNQIRVVMQDGEVWFVAKDVCEALGLSDVNKALEKLDKDDTKSFRVVDTLGREQPNTKIINESGLYTLVLRSNKPEARAFQRWVTKEVLPSIRKTGSYSLPQDVTKMFTAKFFREIADTIEAKDQQIKLLSDANKNLVLTNTFVLIDKKELATGEKYKKAIRDIVAIATKYRGIGFAEAYSKVYEKFEKNSEFRVQFDREAKLSYLDFVAKKGLKYIAKLHAFFVAEYDEEIKKYSNNPTQSGLLK